MLYRDEEGWGGGKKGKRGGEEKKWGREERKEEGTRDV